MLQRQIMFKQLEELQRQQKLQELNGARQQHVFSQQSLIQNKQAPGVQYPPLINGTPVRDASQMFMYGNTNLVHGYQNQILNSMGLASPPVDGHSVSPSINLHGETCESNGEQADTISRSCVSDQFNVSYQDRNMFGPALSQTEIDKQDINPSQEFNSLDPLERKFLYDTNDDSLGGFGNMFEDTDTDTDKVPAAFPSLQNGSWSALMQSALEETSSTDTGVQEEWSGLSFQNPEVPSDNQPFGLMDSGKNLTSWQNNTFQTAPSLKASNAGIQRSCNEVGELEESTQVQRFISDASNNVREVKKEFMSGNQGHSDATTFRSSESSSNKSAVMVKSAGFPAPDLSSQTSRHMLEHLHMTDKFRGYKHGTESAYADSDPTNEMPKAENTDAFTPSRNSSGLQYPGLMSGPATQRPPLNYFNLSQISQHVDNSHLLPFKGQDGRKSSIFEGQQVSMSTKQPNVWVGMPSQQNLSGMGFNKAPSGSPSTSDLAVNRTQLSPLNPAYANPNARTTFKSENADSDIKVPQLTSMSQLNSVYENYKTMLMPSVASEGQSVLNSSHSSLQDAYPLYGNSPSVQMNIASTSQYRRVWPVTGTSSRAIGQDLLAPQSKKRKFPTCELLPWHKEATEGSSRLHDMSTAEVEWAQAANRIPEMLKEQAEALGGSTSMAHSKKRLILTTQLMQVLFRPASAVIVLDDATKCYHSLTYFAARLALGDACSLSNRFDKSCNKHDPLPGKAKDSGDQNLSEIVEDFIKRTEKLENDLSRFENGESVLEIRMESQDLERFSVINRFAKFHSRAQMVAAETASSGGASTAPKLYPQRYVKASPMPMTVPQGYNCLSL